MDKSICMGSTLQDLYKYKTNKTPPNHLQSGMLKEIASSSNNAHLCFLIFKYLSATFCKNESIYTTRAKDSDSWDSKAFYFAGI